VHTFILSSFYLEIYGNSGSKVSRGANRRVGATWGQWFSQPSFGSSGPEISRTVQCRFVEHQGGGASPTLALVLGYLFKCIVGTCVTLPGGIPGS
jgi:hypothetical protein